MVLMMTNERIKSLEDTIKKVQELQESLNKQDTEKALDFLHSRVSALENEKIRDYEFFLNNP